jgi:hypothetical protein
VNKDNDDKIFSSIFKYFKKNPKKHIIRVCHYYANYFELSIKFNEKNESKLYISLALGVKIMKPNPKNPSNQGLFVVPRACPNFL